MTNNKSGSFLKLVVRPGGRPPAAYPIITGMGASCVLRDVINGLSADCRVLIVTDANVGSLYMDKTVRIIRPSCADFHAEVLPPGEKTKNFTSYIRLVARLAALDDARDLIIIALGGGVVGDLAGFAAATYRRGIPVIQVPTTLLACVDSSVGGKTGIDLPEGKNLLGAFHQPSAVVIDVDFLKTLPGRELRSGLAEVIKYGLIMDAGFADRVERGMKKLLAMDPVETARVVKRCCELKAKVVSKDERDTRGVRALLNFGHTFAHAIEAACGYGRYHHGEAVGVGMICAANLSAKAGLLPAGRAEKIEKIIISAGLPSRIKGTNPETLLSFMKKDKKTRGGRLRFVLLEEIGRAVVSQDIDTKLIRKTLKERII